jgi:hypothetical protein
MRPRRMNVQPTKDFSFDILKLREGNMIGPVERFLFYRRNDAAALLMSTYVSL